MLTISFRFRFHILLYVQSLSQACRDENILLRAIEANVSINVIKKVLEINRSLAKYSDHHGRLPLHLIVSNKEMQLAELLPNMLHAYPDGAKIPDFAQKLPLHYAASRSDMTLDLMVQILDAFPNALSAMDKEGNLPFHYSIANQSVDIALTLINRYPECISIFDGNGIYPVFRALMLSLDTSIIERILQLDPLEAQRKNELGQYPIIPLLLDCGQKTFASSHPYEDNMNTFEIVSSFSAKKFTITFDSQTVTEKDYDFVRFYKTGTKNPRSEQWGESKYSGEISNRNFPGVDGNPPLVIEAKSFEFNFISDSNGSEWGYEFTARWDDDEFIARRTALIKLFVDAFPEAVKQPISGVLGTYSLSIEGNCDDVIYEDLDLKSNLKGTMSGEDLYHIVEQKMVVDGEEEVMRGRLKDGGWITLEQYSRVSKTFHKRLMQVPIPESETSGVVVRLIIP